KFFVDSIQSMFTFCYKDETGQVNQINIEKKILVPDYATALKRLTVGRNLKIAPLYTHMTRLF
ncbi:MAG TPA: hypothetical protein VHA52_10915, partial [Candidatus Babeliaceae bacterium]|nr:hypothetical protein [Candidatus Babeliaceae bacterium]